jgi:hypothetical protein
MDESMKTILHSWIDKKNSGNQTLKAGCWMTTLMKKNCCNRFFLRCEKDLPLVQVKYLKVTDTRYEPKEYTGIWTAGLFQELNYCFKIDIAQKPGMDSPSFTYAVHSQIIRKEGK